jgi:hypothetical protein
MRVLFIAVVALLPAQGQDALEIIRKSIDRDITNFDYLKNYTYQQRQESRMLDAKGKVKHTHSETTEVMILAGQPYEKVIAKDDKPLSEKDAQKEQEKIDKELTRRQNMSEKDKATLEKERRESREFLRELPEAFTFKLLGEDTVSGQPTWVIDAEPRPGFRPKHPRAKLLAKVRGKIWVDKGEYQWVKAEAETLDTMSFGLALFRLAPGTTIHFEQARLNGEVWLPGSMHMKGAARVGYMVKLRAEVDLTYSDYKKFQSESKIVAAEVK